MNMRNQNEAGRVVLRPASTDDAAELLAIYAPFVRETLITYECDVPTVAEFAARIADIQRDYPYIVAAADGCIAGYAYAHRYRERAAYDWDVETSIYIDPRHCGRGIGRALYGALLALLTLQGVQNAYACISLPNPASVGLQKAFGFTHAATFEKTGYKLGRWNDSATYGKALGDYCVPPVPVRRIGEVDEADVRDVLARFSVR